MNNNKVDEAVIGFVAHLYYVGSRETADLSKCQHDG